MISSRKFSFINNFLLPSVKKNNLGDKLLKYSSVSDDKIFLE